MRRIARPTSLPSSVFARRWWRGITLVEVLATMVLIGIVLPVAMQGATLSMQAASATRHRIEAGELAELKLNEMLVVRDVNSLNSSGDFGEEWPEYRWTSQAVSTKYSLYEVAVTVTWQQRGQERSVTLTSLVYPSPQGYQ